jgi:cytochrome oxidase Cu insertion factor (SCO1/SenC/PrrC family)
MVRRICCVACLLMGVLWGGRGQVAWQDPLLPDEGAVLYRSLPNVPVYLSGGRVAQLSEFWEARPMLLVFVFSRCAGICSPLLQSLRKTSASVGGVGDAYQIVVLSFDTRDTPEQLLKRFRSVLQTCPRNLGWHYGTVAPNHSAPTDQRDRLLVHAYRQH